MIYAAALQKSLLPLKYAQERRHPRTFYSIEKHLTLGASRLRLLIEYIKHVKLVIIGLKGSSPLMFYGPCNFDNVEAASVPSFEGRLN